MKRALSLAALVLLASCSKADDGPFRVSVIGSKPKLQNPDLGAVPLASQALNGAVVQGLLAFNVAGEVVPALAESWTPTTDGLSLILRIAQANWPDGKQIKASDVVQSLQTSIGPGSRNPLRPLFQNVTEIIPQTDRVLEIRMSAPVPYLTQLLAQPDMAIKRKGQGSGPFIIHLSTQQAHILWRKVPVGMEKDISEADQRKTEVRLWGEPAANAIARYAAGQSRAVLGATHEHVPYLWAAEFSGALIRRDPVSGLFGFTFSSANAALASADVRKALAMAVDRKALFARFNMAGWTWRESLLPVPIDRNGAQAQPGWQGLALDERRKRARGIIASAAKGRLQISMAAPHTPGARLLFAHLRADWARIGVTLRAAPAGTAPDLELLDAVAPYNGAGWYFGRLGCHNGYQCSAEADDQLMTARKATGDEDRTKALVAADQALSDAQIFLPLGQPLRWSIADPKLPGFKENQQGVHTLDALRPPLRD